jgi:hypothetical protein
MITVHRAFLARRIYDPSSKDSCWKGVTTWWVVKKLKRKQIEPQAILYYNRTMNYVTTARTRRVRMYPKNKTMGAIDAKP